MESEYSLFEILSHPQDNGIVIFVSGFLFIFGLYHFLLFFQHRDKAYLYYSLYAFLVLIYTYHRAHNFFLTDVSKPIIPYLEFLYDPIKWLYSTIYLLFAISFVDLKKYFPKWDKYIRIFVQISLSALTILVVISVITGNSTITDYGYNFLFLPILFIFSLFILFIIWNTTSPVKYYLLIGAGVYMIVTLYSHYLTYTGHPFRVLFYAAIMFEMIFFALGLGAKQKKILEDRYKAQKMIIKQHEENLKLKNKIQQELDDKVEKKSRHIIELTKENEEQKRNKLKLEHSKQLIQLRMQAIQAQMNPHFLFNTLNSIKNFIIKNNKKDAVTYLSKFANLIRLILDNSQLQEISLKDEIEIIKLYVEVENIRFNNEILFDVQVDGRVDLAQIKIPPLILQPFIENSIWHGLALKKGKKKIFVKIKEDKSFANIIIEDNGIGREKAMEIRASKLLNRESLGIKLTEERLATYTKYLEERYKLKFEDLYDEKESPTGTRIIISLPVVSKKEV